MIFYQPFKLFACIKSIRHFEHYLKLNLIESFAFAQAVILEGSREIKAQAVQVKNRSEAGERT
jgi:urease gamma subunit